MEIKRNVTLDYFLGNRFSLCGDANRRTKCRKGCRNMVTRFRRVIPLILIIFLVFLYHTFIVIATSMEGGDESLLYASLRKRNLNVPDDMQSMEGKSLYEATLDPRKAEILKSRGPISKSISCPALFDGDKNEIAKAKEYMATHSRYSIQDKDYLTLTKDCKLFKESRGYIASPQSEEESDFPIAFSILMYKNVEQIERLLRAIYMPQNFYCLHVDTKASSEVHLAIRALARCFPNVFVASKLESIYWGHISILQAEMNCLHDLMRYNWKYYINLSGQMFPLQTNANLVKILKIYNGANDIEGTIRRNQHIWMWWRQAITWKLVKLFGGIVPSLVPKSTPPHDITIYKGTNQVAASREFIEFALYDEKSLDLYDWLKDTHAPDEYYLPSLNHNKHLNAPGAYTADPEDKVFTARATLWLKVDDQINWSWDEWECHGKWVRHICIIGVGDLPWTKKRPELFFNKLFIDYEPLTFECLEELHYNRTIGVTSAPINQTYYKNMDIVKHREFINLPHKPVS